MSEAELIIFLSKQICSFFLHSQSYYSFFLYSQSHLTVPVWYETQTKNQGILLRFFPFPHILYFAKISVNSTSINISEICFNSILSSSRFLLPNYHISLFIIFSSLCDPSFTQLNMNSDHAAPLIKGL